ncbi:MAG: hypothetical protein GTO02_10220, partial [Candidatus Dadabacteria bacterium]|nr:hypothetical protein [Candidatus Dadabacteria bacterium]
MLSGLMGLPSAYLFVNFIFLIICSVILYLYFRKTFGDEKYALIAVALFMTSMPIIVWVPAVLVDMGTYLGCAILLYYTSFPFHDKLKDFMARIFLYAFAVLLKPSLAAIVLFCVL